MHIGDAKCGSSSIQSSLEKSKSDLLSSKILYHPATKSNGHYSHLVLLNGRTRGNDSKQRELAEKNIREIKGLISKFSPDYLILSAENFFGIEPGKILSHIHDITGSEITDIHVVAFVRDPVGHYLSTLQQHLKADHLIPSPDSYSWNPAKSLRRWVDTISGENLYIRRFDRERLRNRSVVSEFEDIIRKITSNSSVSLRESVTTETLSAEQIVVLQKFRRDFLRESRAT